MLDAEIFGERRREVGSRAREQRHDVPFRLVRAHAAYHRGLEVLAHHVSVPQPTMLGDGLLAPPTNPSARARRRALDVEQPELVLEEEVDGTSGVAATDLAALPQELHVQRPGVPRYQRTVDIKEGSDRHEPS